MITNTNEQESAPFRPACVKSNRNTQVRPHLGQNLYTIEVRDASYFT